MACQCWRISSTIRAAARPRWLCAFFTSGGSSAKVLPNAGMCITGSKPKPPSPARLARDLAHHAAHGDQRLGVVGAAQRHQGADHGGAAVVDARHLLQQRAHVVGVALGVAELGGVVGRVDARQARRRHRRTGRRRRPAPAGRRPRPRGAPWPARSRRRCGTAPRPRRCPARTGAPAPCDRGASIWPAARPACRRCSRPERFSWVKTPVGRRG
jgi:hypothetical protein